MVFKRRDRRPYWRIAAAFMWPRTGWTRAFQYVKHRVRRLPDRPDRIARGIFAGVFTVFTPFYGAHFLIAAAIALVMRGNVIAALLATFVGNPLTYLPIAVISLQTGHMILGRPPRPDHEVERTLGGTFADAFADLRGNVAAMFTDRDMDWDGLTVFYHDIFFPYMVGGLVPGIIAALAAYTLSLPLIRAYQARRTGALQDRLKRLKSAKAAKAAKSESK